MTIKLFPKSDVITVILHWALVFTIFFSLSTGMRISADAKNATWARLLDIVSLQGNVFQWHVWSAFSFSIIIIGYIIFISRARLKNRISLDSTRLKGLMSGDRDARWATINVFIYWLAFLLVIAGAITGTLLYAFSGLLQHELVSSIHEIVAWLIIAYIGIHIIAQAVRGGLRQLLKIFSPQGAYGTVAGFVIAIMVVVAGGIYLIDGITIRDLTVAKVTTAPILDGDASDPVWRIAKQVNIHTINGANLPHPEVEGAGEVTVSVRAIHHDDMLYMLFEWPDQTRSQKHLPLVKTAAGWKVTQVEFGIQDEDLYYEDKFGVMLARSSELAGAGTSHLGPKPLDGKPGALGGRGLHYTQDGSNVDVWHWKSVRTGNSIMSQIDDNHFGPPLELNPKKKRYPGGYTQDPKQGGGFAMNWEKFSDGIITPKWLPKNKSAIQQHMGKVNLDAYVGDDGEFWMAQADTIPYSLESDIYPVGSVIPAVVINGPFEGDRGDVSAHTRWENGKWVMEVSRKLITGSKYDVPIRAGEPVYLWVSVFDHSQTRHSYHLHPVKVVME